ncbi:MAG: B12-binding domain-containing radical SAM protein [Acidobacteriia bacterium]|nr:B12-binding domain-containing radical SAM protein [Terriglobia bacterium]
MKILLLRAKPDFMDMVIGIPIGLTMVGAMAERLNHKVEILDLALEKTQDAADRRLQSLLQTKKFDLVGLTAMTVEYEAAARAARMVKQSDPAVPVVFGGQHATIKVTEVLSQDFCDFVVKGEGESVFSELVTRLSDGGSLDDVRGLAFKRNGEIVQTSDQELIQDLDGLPYPAYHLLEVEQYFAASSARATTKHKRCMQVFTSRGCPWRCTYCHDLFGKSFRGRSPENVLGELKLLYDRWGIREYMVEDDIFNLDMERAKKIFDLVRENLPGVYFQFGNGLRLERFDEELVRKMAEGGTHYICIAIESASPRIQKMIKKNLKLDKSAEALRWMRKHRIRTLGFFMLGFPTETLEEIQQTIEYASQLDLDEALFSIATPYPGTELNKQVMEMSLYDPDLVSRGGEEFQLIKTEQFDYHTLRKLQRKAYRSFFLSKFRYLRMIPKLVNVNSSMKYLRAIERNFLAYGGAKTSRIN